MVLRRQAKTPRNGAKFKYFYLVPFHFPLPIRLVIPRCVPQSPSTFLFAPPMAP